MTMQTTAELTKMRDAMTALKISAIKYGGITTFYQDKMPGPEFNLKEGDIWYSGATKQTQRWNGRRFVKVASL